MPDTCAAHRPFERKIDDGFREMRDRFDGVNRRFDDLFRDLGAREEADKTQGREIAELKRKAEAVPRLIADGIADHRGACAIGDITKTEVRLPESERRSRRREPESYDTPERGTRRQSIVPSGGVFKIPVPKFVIWLAIGIGVAIAAGGWAYGLLRDEAAEILPQRPAATAPARSELPRPPLADVGARTP
jgi:hypothetical protein